MLEVSAALEMYVNYIKKIGAKDYKDFPSSSVFSPFSTPPLLPLHNPPHFASLSSALPCHSDYLPHPSTANTNISSTLYHPIFSISNPPLFFH